MYDAARAHLEFDLVIDVLAHDAADTFVVLELLQPEHERK